MGKLKRFADKNVLYNILLDHLDTFSTEIDEKAARIEKVRSSAVYYGIPIFLGCIFFFRQVELQGVAQLISGVTILTAFLFALLVLMFNTSLTLKKDGPSFTAVEQLKKTTTALRMNVTYAAIVAVSTSAVLVVASATTPVGATGTSGGLHAMWTPPLVVVFSHLAFTLLMILARLRKAFNYI